MRTRAPDWSTDIELIDDYPSHFSAYSPAETSLGARRLADCAVAVRQVPDESGRLVHNPISHISRWKIFDNLRRSLVEP